VKLDEAIQMDIANIMPKFGGKYDGYIQKILDYAKALNPSGFKKRGLHAL
jgi:hypothetical protein